MSRHEQVLHRFFVSDDNVSIYHHQDVQQYFELHYVLSTVFRQFVVEYRHNQILNV